MACSKNYCFRYTHAEDCGLYKKRPLNKNIKIIEEIFNVTKVI